MYSQVLDSTHYFIPKNELVLPIEQLRERFTVKSKFKGNDPIETFRETEKFFGVPRHYQNVGNLADQIIDARSEGTPIDFKVLNDLRPRQVPVFEEFHKGIVSGITGFLADAPTGSGKCLGKGTPLLMYDGTIKAVEDVLPGELLMGPDSTPRTVLSIARGTEELFKVTPVKGEPYVVNKSHILSLKITGTKDRYSFNGEAPRTYPKGAIINMTVEEYLSLPASKKHVLKGWRTGVDFPPTTASFWLDPYTLGVWLGDGTSTAPSFSNPDPEIKQGVQEYADSVGLLLHDLDTKEGKCPQYSLCQERGDFLSVNFRDILKDYNLLGNKHIPQQFKTASRDDRLKLLAGLIDTDGYLSPEGGFYEITQKVRTLAYDIAFVARSLGLAAYVREDRKRCCNTDAWGTYYRVTISGDVSVIPCRLARKVASPRLQKKDVLVTGIKLESLGEGDYYGFSLDGDRLFMLGDFTVTHNTFLGLKFLEEIGRTALIIVPREFIIDQWKERILEHTNLKESDIGIAQGPVCDYKGKKIVLGMIHSLSKDKYPDDFLKYFGVVLIDEVHTVSAVTFAKVVSLFPAKYRIGLSATMKRTDGMENVFKWAIGETLLHMGGTTDVVPTVFIKQYKSSMKKRDYLYKVTDVTRRCGIILSSIAEDASRNQLIAHYAKKFAESGRKTVILSHRKEQLKSIHQILTGKLGVPHSNVGFFVGQTKKAEKQGILENSRIILATYGVMSMAIDVPDLRALIYGTPQSDAEQSIGRILRMCEGSKDPVALDIVDVDYKECVSWEVKRRSMYTRNKAKVIYLNGEK